MSEEKKIECDVFLSDLEALYERGVTQLSKQFGAA
jgi:hypothetical protein